MPAARGWANAAIVIALVVSPIIVCIGLFHEGDAAPELPRARVNRLS